jgi:hypothetical protein
MEIEQAIKNLTWGESVRFPLSQRKEIQNIVDDLRDQGMELVIIEDPEKDIEVENGEL